MIRFITHFDANYLAQGLTMLTSLKQHMSEQFDAEILWLDDNPFPTETVTRLPVFVEQLRHFLAEYPQVADVRSTRSWKSFCWSLEPAVVHSILNSSDDGQIVVYCDSDMWWLADPIPDILGVMERADVALSRHHFPAGQEHRERTCGIWNFGVGVFRACDLTRRVVGEWLNQTLAQCDETVNDQHHLDSWEEKLGDRLTELSQGVNVGPWQNPIIDPETMRIISGNGARLISYHFHETRRGIGKNPAVIKGEDWNLTNYFINASARQYIYEPYLKALEAFL